MKKQNLMTYLLFTLLLAGVSPLQAQELQKPATLSPVESNQVTETLSGLNPQSGFETQSGSEIKPHVGTTRQYGSGYDLELPIPGTLAEMQDGSKRSDSWRPNANPYKYLLGNSAMPMEQFTGYYQNVWIFFNNVAFAFTDWFSLSAGFEIISILAQGQGPFIYNINPKITFPVIDRLYVGGNIMYINTIRRPEDFNFDGIASLNGFATYGTTNHNVTAALGWGWFNGEFSSEPVISVSGMTRVSDKIGFVSENWIVPNVGQDGGYYGVFSYGIRFLGDNTAIDLAFVNNADIADALIIGIPFLDFVVGF